jgi:hypothetical protein
MPEIGTSGSMSGDGKRSVAEWPKLPRPSSTLPKRTNRAGLLMSVVRCRPEVAGRLSKRRTRSEHWPPRLELSLRSGLLTSGDNIRLERSNLFQEGLRLTELDLAAG